MQCNGVIILETAMSKLTIREVMDKHFAETKFDQALCKRITEYCNRFMNRNEDHSAFFGGVLLGVNPIRFYETDRELWFDDVLGIDDDLLRADFNKVDSIDPSHNVVSDPFNHIPGYVCFRLLQERNIPLNIRHEAMVSLFMVLHFKYLTSLLVRRFKYPAKREVAEATFLALNYKWDIRRLGSWHALIRDRAEGIIAPDSIYAGQIHKADEDYWSSRIVTDTQGRIRELINKIYSVYIKTLQEGSRIVTTREMVPTTDGDSVLRDKASGYASYLRYMQSTVQSEQNFIRPELLGVVERAMNDVMPAQPFEDTLRYLSRNINQPRSKHISQMIDECLLYTFDFMQSIRTQVSRNNDLEGLLSKIRAKIMASRSSDPRVLYLRDTGEKIVRDATNVRNPAVLAATRTGVMLYIILRALTKSYYAK